MEELRAHQSILSKKRRSDDDDDSDTPEPHDSGTKSVQSEVVSRVGKKSSPQCKDVRVFIPRVDSLKKLNRSVVSDEADSGTDSIVSFLIQQFNSQYVFKSYCVFRKSMNQVQSMIRRNP